MQDVSQTRNLSETVRQQLLNVGTAAKVAFPLRQKGLPLGLICADWSRTTPRWNEQSCLMVVQLADHALSPILSAAAMLRASDARCPQAAPESLHVGKWSVAVQGANSPMTSLTVEPHSRQSTTVRNPNPVDLLTPAEKRVALLAAKGMSYKEIAAELDRAVATIDHQLRQLRSKLGASSTPRLVQMLRQYL